MSVHLEEQLKQGKTVKCNKKGMRLDEIPGKLDKFKEESQDAISWLPARLEILCHFEHRLSPGFFFSK